MIDSRLNPSNPEQKLHPSNVYPGPNHVDGVTMPQRMGMHFKGDHSAIFFDQIPHVLRCEGEEAVLIPNFASETYTLRASKSSYYGQFFLIFSK